MDAKKEFINFIETYVVLTRCECCEEHLKLIRAQIKRDAIFSVLFSPAFDVENKVSHYHITLEKYEDGDKH